MIILIFTLVFNFFHFLIGLLPAGTGFPASVHSAFSTLGGYFGIMDVFVPLSVLYWCLAIIFSVEIALFGYKTLNWVIAHIPGLGGEGMKD